MRDIAPSMLTPPALPRDLVSRPALRAALDAGADRALTLVCAPPGYGKSLLVADWVRRSPDVATAWLSLDEDVDDPRQLWSAVLAALRACPAVPPSSRLRRLIVSRTALELDFVDDLLAGLAALPQRIRLVLDDVHHLPGGTVLDHLRMLVRDHGPRVQLVMISRLDPPLPLARWRLDDDLCELRADRLRFSVRESAALLERVGLRLEPRQCALLHERTGGWVAGLRLAARSLLGHPDPAGFLAAFSGDDRSVADYLVGEVLAEIPGDQREVLRRTSIVDPVPGALAVELCDREDAADLMNALEHDLGLVTCVGPDRTDYHVQEMLRSYLVADLYRQGDDLAAALHRRATVWWDRQGRPADALRYAGRTGDAGFVAELVRRRAAALVASGDSGTVRAALTTLGDEPGTDLWRAAVSALADLARGHRAAVAATLRRARQRGRHDEGSDVEVLLTATERLAGLDLSPPAAEPLPDDPALAALARAGRGATTVAIGSSAEGRVELAAALDTARRLGLTLLEAQCLCMLAYASWADGDLVEAASTADAAMAAVRDGGWDDTGWAASARAVAALTALERARPDVALETAGSALHRASAELDPVVRFALQVARGGALFDTGERAAGLLELQQARTDVGESPVPAALAVTAALLEQRSALRLGYANAASAGASRLVGRADARFGRLLMRAWATAAAGDLRAAGEIVAPVTEPSAGPVRPSTVVEAWLVTSTAAVHDGDRPVARHALRSALDLALPLDIVRPFTLAPFAVRALLVDELVSGNGRARFAARVLAAPRRPGRPADTVLTAREQDVLARLPSLLNLDEIAVDLAVSVNTVKSHVRSIYDKLGVGTRRRAVLAAHERGLYADPADRARPEQKMAMTNWRIRLP